MTRIRTIDRSSNDPNERFPNRLAKLEGTYTILLEEGAKPYAPTVPRQVAIPLMQPVKDELCRMEKLGVISRVKEPTEWCAAMVFVPKSNQKVRICVDLTHLNKSIHRERHPLPAVEQSLAQLAGACILNLRCQLRVLANPIGPRECIVDNVHHTFWQVLLSLLAIRHHFCAGAFSEADVRDTLRPRWCGVYDG